MLRLLTGRNYFLRPALLRETGAALSAGDRTLVVVVPRQLTLETEHTLLGGLNLRGSFRLQVSNPQRLCERIFDAAGWPEGVRVDARGRVMLLRRALISERENLTLYRGAQNRLGFAERAARQIEALRQADLTPDALHALAQGETGSFQRKLLDLSCLLSAYERAIAGRFQDGETEFLEAARRAQDAEFLRDCEIWFYGFDSMPPVFHEWIAELAVCCPRVSVLLPLETDARARDADLFAPLRASAERLVLAAREKNATIERVRVLEQDARATPLRHLESALFSGECPPYPDDPGKSVVLFEAKNPLEEARLAAAWARGVVQRDGLRWMDVRVLCADVETYAQPLMEAFAACEIPLFLASSRAASRHALAECLLTALALLEKNLRQEDLLAFVQTGYLEISADEADRLSNYIAQYRLEGISALRPLRRGPDAVREALEPVRARAFAPLTALRNALKDARSLPEQLEALFSFLTALHAYEKSLDRQRALTEAGLFTLAGEEAQVWNRILGTLDQMHDLMGPDRLSLRAMRQTLRESLDAALVKSLPQSGDAVYVQAWTSAAMTPARAAIVLGAVDRSGAQSEGLFTEGQLRALSAATRRFVGLTAQEATCAQLCAIKAAVGMTTDRLYVSYPLSAADGSAERPGLLVRQLLNIFPGLLPSAERRDRMAARLLMSAPLSAVRLLSMALSEGRTEMDGLAVSTRVPEVRQRLRVLAGALRRREAVDRLSPDTARALFGKLSRASITRLERFAGCPFSHFLQYGIKPVLLEPYVFSPRDEGALFHDAVHSFLSACADDSGTLDPERAEARMDEISDVLLQSLRQGALGATAVSLAEERRLRGVLRTSARALADQLANSQFHPAGLELSFGRDGDAPLCVGPAGDCALEGRIDFIDLWRAPEGESYLRVIDFKRGRRKLSATEAYYGLQLQLLTYLAAAIRLRQARPAGVFYFRLDEGIVETAETDPALVSIERQKSLRMEGLPPRDPRVLAAMSPEIGRVLNVRPTKDGTLPEGAGVEECDFDALIRHTLEVAGEQVAAIRAGASGVSPLRTPDTDPCKYCDFRGACMQDGTENARWAGRMKMSELVSRLHDR